MRGRPDRKQRRPRWLRLTLGGLGIGLLAVALTLWLATRSQTVLQAALGLASGYAERSWGYTLEAERLRLRVLRGDLEATKLVVRRDGRPVAEVDRLRAGVDLFSLLGTRPVVRAVEVEGVSLDLRAPLADLPSSAADDGGRGGIEIEGIVVREATVYLPPAAGAGLREWRLEKLGLEGSYVNDRLQLSSSTDLVLIGSPFPSRRRFEVALKGAFEGEELSLELLRLQGEGLDFDGEGGFTLAADGSAPEMRLRFALAAETGVLFDVEGGGPLRVEGELESRDLSGELSVDGRRLPAGLLVHLDTAALASLDLDGAFLDLEARFRRRGGEAASGEAGWQWRRADSTLLSGELRLDRLEVDGEGRPLPETLSGEARFVSTSLPFEVVEPLLSSIGLGDLGGIGPGSHFDLDARLAARPHEVRPWSVAGLFGWALDSGAGLEIQSPGVAVAVEEGGVDPLALTGELRASVRALPVVTLRRWVGDELFEGLGADGTTLDAEVTAELDPAVSRPLRGRVEVVWREGTRELVRAAVVPTRTALDDRGRLALDRLGLGAELRSEGFEVSRLLSLVPAEHAELVSELASASISTALTVRGLPRRLVLEGGEAELTVAEGDDVLLELAARVLDGEPAGLGVTARVLPGDPGRRELRAEVVSRGWQELMEAELRGGEVVLTTPDLGETLAALARRWPARVRAPDPRWPLDASLEARAELSGTLLDPTVELAGHWRARTGGEVRVEATGAPRELRGSAEVRWRDLDLAPWVPELGGRIEGTLQVDKENPGLELESWRGALDLRGQGLELAGQSVAEVRLKAATDGQRLEIEHLEARQEARRLAATGEVEWSAFPEWATLRLTLAAPENGIDEAELDVVLGDGAVRIESRRLLSSAGSGRFAATVPLGALARLPGLNPALAERLRSADPSAAPIALTAHIPHLTSKELAGLLGQEEEPTALDLRELRLSLVLEPQDLMSARGELEIGHLEVGYRGHTLASAAPVVVDLRGYVLELSPLALGSAEKENRRFEIQGRLRLREGWSPGDHEAGPIRALELGARGSVELDLLHDFLLGGVGSGPIEVDVSLAGPLDRLVGRVGLRGPQARIDYLAPYVSRFENLDVLLDFAPGETTLRKATARLNQGELRLAGELATPTGTRLLATFDDVRYRLDYGLSAVLAGELKLSFPPADAGGSGLIAGDLVVERGLVRRDVDLERELFARLLAPNRPEGVEGDGEPIGLDVRLTTRQGVRVRNNVADLTAVWSPILVRGTLDEPRVDGVLDVEPGGRVFAYGQALRLDRATVRLSSQPGAEPRIDLVTTSSLEDPSITRSVEGNSLDPFAAEAGGGADGGAGDRIQAVGVGFADYLGRRLAAGLGGVLGDSLGGFTVRPLVVLGESDPDARLTVGRELAPAVDLAVSLNMRTAERRTYLLHFHDLPKAPTVQAQLFTNEASHEGATLQQSLELGAGARESRPQVGRIRFVAPDSLDTGPLRRAIRIDRGEPLPDGFLFDTEIDITEALGRLGYSAPRVAIGTQPAAGNRVDIEIAVDPGSRTEVEFVGVRPATSWRRSISSLYRSDVYEEASLDEMRRYTVRALRSVGYLEPEVTLEVERAAGEAAAQRIVVKAEGGRRLERGPLTFTGVSDDEAERLRERFATPLARAELAAGVEAANRRLLAGLQALGYPQAEIVGRSIGGENRGLTVELQTGPVQRIRRVDLAGVDDEEVAALRSEIELEAGDVASADRLAAAAFAAEESLRRRGYNDARATASVEPVGGDPASAVATIQVEPGEPYVVAAVEVEGLQVTRPKWAASLAGVATGSPLETRELVEVRRRYLQSGLFSTVVADLDRTADGQGRLRIELEERPRFSVAYGVRWESEEGTGVVVDLLDRNAFGRGVAIGARGLYTEDRQLGRFYSSAPRFLGSRYTLESLLELRQEDEDGLMIDTFESSLQLSRPLRGRGTGRIYARYRSQHFTEPDPFLPLDERVRSPVLGVQYIYDRRTDPLSGRSGLFASLDLSGSEKALGSDISYVRLFGQLSAYRPAGRVGRRQLGWSQSYRVGLAEPFDQALLRDLRFFAGGEFSVRGYPAESLGPVEDLGVFLRPRGGDALFVMNQELHAPLWNRFRGVAFLDVGNVWEKIETIDSDLSMSIGLGLRVDSPAGLLRLDLAFPLDRREDDPSAKVYIGFGQIF